MGLIEEPRVKVANEYQNSPEYKAMQRKQFQTDTMRDKKLIAKAREANFAGDYLHGQNHNLMHYRRLKNARRWNLLVDFDPNDICDAVCCG
jgi:hypothetical protein